MDNTEANYWIEKGYTSIVAPTLAYIAGDYANMEDSEVLRTYVNESATEVRQYAERENEDDITEEELAAIQEGLAQSADLSD